MPNTSKEPIIVLYDGMCSICSASATKLVKLDNNRNKLKLVDLRTDQKLIEQHQLQPVDVRRVMHAITPDGQIHIAMNAVRLTMHAVGRSWMINWTKLPIIRPITDRIYIHFANNRLRWFGKSKCDNQACSTNPDAD